MYKKKDYDDSDDDASGPSAHENDDDFDSVIDLLGEEL